MKSLREKEANAFAKFKQLPKGSRLGSKEDWLYHKAGKTLRAAFEAGKECGY